MPTTSQQRLEPTVRREQIASAAARVFARRYPTEVSFDDVATEAGVSRGLVYKYFGDRQNLLAAAYLHDLDSLDERIRAATDACDTDADRLRAVIDTYLGFALECGSSSRLIASLGTLRHPAVQAAMERRIDTIAAQFGATPEAMVVARGVVGLLESASIYWVDHSGAGVDDLIDVADLLFRVLWSGLTEVAVDLGLGARSLESAAIGAAGRVAGS